jgi:diguanylate cyclase (GGDEF)-like protein
MIRSQPRRRVFMFSLDLAGLGLIWYLLAIDTLPPVNAPVHLPWPVLALGCFVAESRVIDIHFRRETHSLTLSELPAVIGLYFVDPQGYVVGVLVGALGALLLLRQPMLKIFFNLSQYLLGAVLTLAVFRALGEFAGVPSVHDWMATFAATVTASVFSAATIALVITLSGAAPQLQRLPQMIQVGAAVAVANTSLALLAVTILWVNPLAIWLLTIPVLTLFIAYQAYLSERQKHESLELLYESSRIFQRSPELDEAMLALVEHLRNMFHSDRGEIFLRDASGSLLRTTIGPDASREVMAPAEADIALWERIVHEGHAFVYQPGEGATAATRMLYRQAMVSPLRGEDGLMGAIVVSDRSADGEPFSVDELRLLETVSNQAAVALQAGQLEQSLAELSRLKEELRHQAFHDSLTGIPNRRLVIERTEDAMATADSQTAPVVLFLDLDDFKVVNDALGHAAGDQLLIAVARRIEDSIRKDDLVARLGGDEFAVLMSDGPNLANALGVASRIVSNLRAPVRVGAQEVVVGASIGIAAAHARRQPAEELLRDADVAMYSAKASGKGRISVFEPEMHEAILERHAMSRELSMAVSHDELFVLYQPIVALHSGRIEGLEALVRWRHPTRGIVSPDAFISLAEESGAIVPLGRQVLRDACRQVARWGHMQGLDAPLFISVNLSPLEVREPDFVEHVRSVLHDTGLDPSRLVLEMTETAIFRDMGATIRKLEELRQGGVRIALDDFGTGYSSLGYLRRFPIDLLKVAREFVGVSDEDSGDWVFAHAIVALGQALGLQIVAEGIEEESQAMRLRHLGCTYGQGFLFAKPIGADEIDALVRMTDGTLYVQAAATNRTGTRSILPTRVAYPPSVH